MGKQVIFGSNISFLMLSLNLFIRIFWNCTWSKGMFSHKVVWFVFLDGFSARTMCQLLLRTFVRFYSYIYIVIHLFNPFSSHVTFQYLLKMSKNLWFFYVFRGIDMWHWAKMHLETNLALLLNTITFFSFCSFFEDKHQGKYKVYNLIWLYY